MEVRKASEGEKGNVSSSTWIPFQDIWVNGDLFKHGIIAVKPRQLNESKLEAINGSNFFIGAPTNNAEKIHNENAKSETGRRGRKLAFVNKQSVSSHAIKEGSNNNHSVSLANCDQNKLSLSSKSLSSIKKTFEILSKVIHFQNSSIKEKTKFLKVFSEDYFAYNLDRRDEIFFPVLLDHNKKISSYFYPWLSSKLNSDFKFDGFDIFVTCGCMFGSTLHGKDQWNYTTPLIKHGIKFHPTQKIQQTMFNPEEVSFYEKMLFSELEKIVTLIEKFSTSGKRKKLVYHLPYYDYMLFGLELFISGRMTFSAYDHLCKAILQKRRVYEIKINEICKTKSVEVEIMSPFENLFGPLLEDDSFVAQFILSKLDLSTNETIPNEIDIENQKKKERELVQRCLILLMNNDINSRHKKIWEDFILAIGADEINTFEDLFKVANAVVNGVASQDKENLKVCAIYPVSEKQIQISVAEYFGQINSINEDEIVRYDKEIKKYEEEIGKLRKALKKNKEALISYNSEIETLSSADDVKKAQDKTAKMIQENASIKSKIRNKKSEISKNKNIKSKIENKLDGFSNKKLSKYPAIFNLTVLEPLLTYESTMNGVSSETNGLPFYADECKNTICALLSHYNLLYTASQNVTHYASGNYANIPALDKVLEKQVEFNNVKDKQFFTTKESHPDNMKRTFSDSSFKLHSNADPLLFKRKNEDNADPLKTSRSPTSFKTSNEENPETLLTSKRG